MTARYVPPGLWVRLIVLSPLGLAGALALLFGQIFGWVFVPLVDVQGLLERDVEVARVPGRVDAVEATSSKVNSRRVYEVRFHWDDAGAPRRGASYGTGAGALRPGDAVEIEVPAGKPERARVAGLSRRPFPGWALIPVLLAPVVGLVLLLVAVALAARRARLLREGREASGRLVDKRPTKVRVNRRRVFAYTYEFTAADGRTGRAVARTHHLDRLDPEREPVLYDPESLRATLLAHLPGRPRVDGDQLTAAPGPGAALGALLLAVAAGGWVVLVVALL